MFKSSFVFFSKLTFNLMSRRFLSNSYLRCEQIGYGPPSTSLQLVSSPFSQLNSQILTKNEVLVKIYASSLNPIDLWMRRGYGSKLFEGINPLPRVLGRDFSGIVLKLGPEVWNLKVIPSRLHLHLPFTFLLEKRKATKSLEPLHH